MSAYIQLLQRNPGYFRLWLAQAISLLGDWFGTIVLLALVTRFSPDENDALAIMGLVLARFLPPLLVAPFAGALVDRLNRKRLLILSDILRGVVVLLFLTAMSADRLWLIYLLTVIQFALSAVFEPGRSALIPSITRPEDLVLANTLGSITWSVMLAAGAVVGGIVAGLLGTGFALVLDALTFGLSALVISGIRVPARRPSLPAESLVEPDTSFVEGLRYLAAHPATAVTALVKLGGSIGSIDLLMTIYATSYFVLGEDGALSLGILWSAYGTGAVLGPIVLNRMNDGSIRVMRRLIIIGYAWITLGWLLFGWAPNLVLASLALLVKAMGGSVYWTYSSVILQKSVPDAYLGRVFSVDMAGFQLSTVVSVVVAAMFVDLLGTDNARVVAYGTAAVSLVPLVLWALAVSWLERREIAVAAAD